MATIEEVKTFSGGLNKDDDPRFLPQGDYTDALNLVSKVVGGTAGVLTSQVGNVEIETYLSYDYSVTKISLDVSTERITTATNVLKSGIAVKYKHALGDTAIGGLTNNTIYYVEQFSSTEFYLHTSEADCYTGANKINLTSDPSGTHEFTVIYVLPVGTNTVVGEKWDRVNNRFYYFVHNSNDRHLILQYNPAENVARLVLENNAWARGYYWWYSAYQGAWSIGTLYAMNDVVEDSGSYYMSLQESNIGINPAGDNTLATEPIYSELYWRKLDDYFPLSGSSTIIAHIESVNRDGDTFLLWANPNGEPCMINVDRCMAVGAANQYPPMAPSDVQLYAATPQWAPKVGYMQDTSLSTNSVREKLYQFKYRYKYRSGEYSAYSPSSRIALPTRNYENGVITVDDIINVKVYLPDNLTNSSGYSWKSEVEEVEVVFRQNGDNNTGSWYSAQSLIVADENVVDGTVVNAITGVSFTTTDEITIGAGHNLITGQPVKYTSTGTAIAGLTSGNIYYVSNVSENNLTLSDTHREALGGKILPLTGAGTGTQNLTTVYDASESPFHINYVFDSGQGSTAVDDLESNQLYDFIPKKAESLILTNGNRVALGNVTHGYDWSAANLNVQLSVQADVQASTLTRWCLKSGSTHQFGIVYSDGNGRLSNVYTNEDCNLAIPYYDSTNKGATWAKFVVAHEPPSWAKYFHIVYGGNKTKSNFITFVGGAPSTVSGNIKSMVMRSVLDMNTEMDNANINYNYSFTEGDIIVPVYDRAAASYYSNLATVGDIDSATVLSYDAGTQTITYKVTGWKGGFSQINAGNIFEIYSPKSNTDTVVWHEVGEQYRISRDANGALAHSAKGWDERSRNQEVGTQSAIAVVEAGDCYVFGLYDSVSTYLGYIDTPSVTYPSFTWAEAKYTAPNWTSKSTSIGRPNAIGNSQEQTYITEIDYSEPYVENTNIFGVSRFYDSNFFSDISESYGAIKRMYSYGDYITVLQELRVSRLLSNKYFINTADLSGGVIGQTQNVFSSPSYFPQEYGCQNPESFAAFGDSMYWVDRIRGAVCRMRGGGIESISEIKMSTYFESNLGDPVISAFINLASDNALIKGAYNIGDAEYIVNLATVDEVKCTTASNGSYSYTLTFSNEDIERGFLAQSVSDGFVYIKAQDDGDYGIVKGVITSSDSTSITIDSETVSGSDFELNTGANYILLAEKTSIAFNQERDRWTSRYSYNPQLMGSFGTDLISFLGGKMYRHTSQPYYDSSASTNKANWNRYYGTVYDSSINFISNEQPIVAKVLLGINVESNQAWSSPYIINNRAQVSELETTDFELLEGQYWSNFLRDKYTPNVTYPLLDGDEMRGAYHEIKLLTSIADGTATDIAPLPVLFSATIEQLYSPIS